MTTLGDPLRDPDGERADGLFTERTELAWTRSGLALLAAFAILARRVWTTGPQTEHALVLALFAIATLGWAFGILGRAMRHRARAEPRPRSARELFAVAAGTSALAGAGLVVALIDV
ncbi:MAG: DUF202 domain-containing protein [Acidimicrobiia bacterium]|jgi:uncharacterized membrane protein YidH (DUF202 family)